MRFRSSVRHAAWLAACALALAPLPASAKARKVEAVYVVLGAQGAVVRAVLSNATKCPAIRIDKTLRTMGVRALPQAGQDAAFPVLVCESLIPAGARSARLAGQALPLPKPRLATIAAFGDTGCRIKSWQQDGHETGDYQDCKNPATWPLARVAAHAAALRPTLVIHVGDYLYRESPCPPQDRGCKGSPSGDAWQTWKADFFAPAAPLLRTSPWIMVRGNHESCKRAGAGYMLLLDPALAQNQALPACADIIAHYTVNVGGKGFIVTDSSTVDDGCTDTCNSGAYAADFAAMKPAPGTWLVTHKPFWAFGSSYAATTMLQQALTAWGGKLPDGIDLALAGHIHVWEALSFADKRSPQLVLGTGGSSLDQKIEAPLTGRAIGGTTVSYGRAEQRFGYTIFRPGTGGAWTATFVDPRGKPGFGCVVKPTEVSCDP